jgi:beta-phosphoglucomutase
MIDTIIFDNEGVVADTESAWDKEQEVFLGRRGITYKRDKTKHLLGGRSIEEGAVILKEIYNLSGDNASLANERFSIIKDLLNREISFIRGFQDFYQMIHQKYKICIATSMDDELLDIVDRKLSLNQLFNGHVYSIQHAGLKSKPDPDIFLFAAKQLKSEPATCIVIEDSPNGLIAAKAAGMKSIGITTTYSREILKDADDIIDYFSDLETDSLNVI